MKRRDLRILVNTNSPHSNSGYGTEARDVFYRLKKDGWPLAISAFFGVQGGPIDIDYRPNERLNLNPELYGTKIMHYPIMMDSWGSDALLEHGFDWKANIAITFQDVWTLNPDHLRQLKYWIPWVPIDKDPVPPQVADRLRYAYKILTISRFGQKVLEKAGFTSTLILEGVDTKIFKPMDKKQARREVGVPEDGFLFGMIAANKENPSRKGFEEVIEAFAIFSKTHPDARILFQTQQISPSSYPIKQHLDYLKIGHLAYYVNDYKQMFLPDSEFINKLYNSFDVLLHPSRTEGFGLCIIESQSAGTPVIVTDSQSMPELVVPGVTGEIVNLGSEKRFTADLSWVGHADIGDLVKKMEKLYSKVQKEEETISKLCQDHIVKNYNVETLVKEQWIPLLEELQGEILPSSKESTVTKSLHVT